MGEQRNVLKEAVVRREGESVWAEIVERAKSSPFYEAVLREGITSDIAGALGRMHDVVVEAAKPALISREIIKVMHVQDALVRFPKAKVAYAYKVGEGAEYFLTGEKYETTDVKADTEIKAGVAYSKKFYEDASWSVLERQTAEIGRAMGELETKTVYDYLIAQAGTTDTGDGNGKLEWTEIVQIWNDVKKVNWNPTAMALHPDNYADLWLDEKFIHQFYWGSQADLNRGILGHSPLGMKIAVSSKCTSDTVIINDVDISSVLLVRRDITTEPYEDPQRDLYGVVASERIGLGVLRSTAIGKLTSA